jgi:hypothetical protein
LSHTLNQPFSLSVSEKNRAKNFQNGKICEGSAKIVKWENQWGNFPRSSPVSVDVFDVSGLRRKRNIQVRESAYSTRLFPTLSSINPKEYGRTCETASKSGKQIERADFAQKTGSHPKAEHASPQCDG